MFVHKWLVRAVFAVLCGNVAWAQPNDPSGIWITGDGRSHVSVRACGAHYCGTVVRLAEPYEADGQPKRDTENPDPAKRNRPLIGMRILHDMAQVTGQARWEGQIYNPEDGKHYAGSMMIRGDQLEVEGCVLIVVCQSQTWTRMK
ncbi:MAG: DUF2147 domain-containing protein [Hyphomicrobiales bacterium]|nr:DUF2147 domain-containing protein [Hyphomicrobiales bacterium]